MAESKISFLLSESELKLLENVLIFEPGLQNVTENIHKTAKGYLAVFSETDIMEALEALPYAAISIAGSLFEKEKYINLHDKIKQKFTRIQRRRRSIGQEQTRKQLDE
ncbi:MAG: hypothetical protein R6U54_03525 [Candidatus Omnitrophota bacterium]